jgi:hypothetical protein
MIMKRALWTALGLVGAASAFGQTWNAGADFSTTSNPNGNWSYGYKDSAPSGTFSLSTTAGNFVGYGDGWSPTGVSRPFVGKLTNQFGTAPAGSIFFHTGIPGQESQIAVLRWTSVTPMILDMTGKFYSGDSGRTDDYVRVTSGQNLFTSLDTATDQSFTAHAILGAGESIDFMVGTGTDGANSDLTPFEVTISGTPVPEPASMAVLGLGALALLRKRRK